MVATVVAIAALSACSGQGTAETEAAGSAASRFSSTAGSDPASACTLLAPQTASELEKSSGDCAKGLTDADLPAGGRVQEVEVYGLDAIVRLSSDTVFLARFKDGWRVTAAGCKPQGEGPYDCDIKGD